MKKKWLLGMCIALCAVAVGGGAFGLASWIRHNESANKTVTVGQPTETTVTGTMNGEDLLPGQSVSQDYTISIDNPGEGMAYNLGILSISDGTAVSGPTWFEISAVKKTEPAGEESFAALGENAALVTDLADGDVVTVTIRLKADAPAEIAGAELTFSLRLYEVEG